jgi:hypothetical protein
MEHGASMGVAAADAYLVRESQGELDLVRGDVGVPPAHDGAGNGGGPRAEGSASNTEGAHDGCGCGGDAIADAVAVVLEGDAEVLLLGGCTRESTAFPVSASSLLTSTTTVDTSLGSSLSM